MDPFAIERRTYADGTVEDVPLFTAPDINYLPYFGVAPVEADHLGNLKAQLDFFRRDLARCVPCQ